MALKVENLEGNEIADYKRISVPRGRWSDTWYVIKTNFLKLVLINLFVLITFAPGIILMFFRTAYLNMLGGVYPFNSSILFPYYSDVTGLAERLTLSTDLLFYAFLFLAGLVASAGIAGATYSIRKIVNTHGEFSLKVFFRGIKVNYVATVFPVSLFLLFLYATVLIGDRMDYVSAMGGNTAGMITAFVFIIIATVLVGLLAAWIYAVGTTYRVRFTQLFKNSFVFCVTSIIRTVIMAGISLIPVWLFMIGGIVRIISYLMFIFVGFSFIILCWTAFTQSVFDAHVKPNQAVADDVKKQSAVQNETVVDDDQRVRELLAAGRSELISHPVMPIAAEAAVAGIGKTFTRKDLSSIAEDREKLGAAVAAYENDHKSEKIYVEYNRLFAEREKALTEKDGKKSKKKKKISAENLLK